MPSTPPELTDSLPQILREQVNLYWQDWLQSCESLNIDPVFPVDASRVGRVWACSEFVARLCTRKPFLLVEMFEQGIDADSQLPDFKARIQQAIDNADDSDESLMQALRVQRQREMLRIAWRDLDGIAGIEQVLSELSDFAEAMVSATLDHLYEKAIQVMGTPKSENGEPQTLLTLGMGKLGGHELNFSSDIDLIFAYAEEGHTEGGRRLTNHEFFLRLARQLVKVLNETTQEGFVFRVDTRLRPYGESGPLVMGFTAIEQYYQSQGRDWERYAMIKARAITGAEADIKHLQKMLRPFIYRRYLDFSAFESIREMKSMIESEVRRKGIRDNVKLGRGGIREIEFIGQTFQLLRGGHDVKLQARGILSVLELLADINLLEADEVDRLKQAYHFLRRLENRIQMERDQQAHNLPVNEIGRQKLSLAMDCGDWSALSGQIETHRENVHEIFQSIVSHEDEVEADSEESVALKAYWSNASDGNDLVQWFEEQEFSDAGSLLQKLDGFKNNARIRALSDSASRRLLNLLSKLLVQIATFSESSVLLERVLEILNAVAGRRVYINLLLEYPEARTQMLSLCAVSHWFVQQLVSNPILLDELLDARELYSSKTHQALTEELDYLLSSVEEGDLEQYMDRMRQFKNTQVMKAAVLDINQVMEITDVGDTLSYIAEVVLVKTLRLVWDEMCNKYGRPSCLLEGETFFPEMAIVAYGKLGGEELGYGSDLDIVFLHNSSGEKQYTTGEKVIDNSTFFSRVAQRVLHILGTRMHSGLLYEPDIRLRPEGNSGMMVSSLTAFERYQQEKAWTWEHQALIRARIVAGNDHVRQEFDRIRKSVLAVERERGALCQEVVEMREKMRAHLASRDPGDFDVKQDTGGIVDIEFVVQAGVLLNAKKYPGMLDTTSTLVYLERLVDCNWLEADESEHLSAAYKEYRSQANRQALQVELAENASAAMQGHREKVISVWKRLMPVNKVD
jgi:glutamate-ammonia-ligase adenylyltransferase